MQILRNFTIHWYCFLIDFDLFFQKSNEDEYKKFMKNLWKKIWPYIDVSSYKGAYPIRDALINEFDEGRISSCIFPKDTEKHTFIKIFGKETKSVRLDVLLALLFVS